MKPILSPAELFAKAQTAVTPTDRIALFRRVVTEFPQDKSAVQAAFMIGFTYAEELKDFPNARTSFQDFIRKYPKSDLVSSAHWMLDNMEHSVPPPEVGLPDSLTFESLPPKAPAPSSPGAKEPGSGSQRKP
jgi:outer membrane protein assembly factor BamD (BamD/ComL family)